jgi:hypothetical protein
MLSVDAQVYFGGRVAFVIVPLVTAYVLLISNRALLRARLATFRWLVLGVLVAGAPVGAYIAQNYAAYMAHTTEVLVLSRVTDIANYNGYLIYHTNNALVILAQQAWIILQTFNRIPDFSLQYGIQRPMLDPVSGALLPAAVAYACFEIRRPGFAVTVLASVCIVVTGGVLTIEAPFWPRIMVVAPFLALLLGALLDRVWQTAERIPHLRVPVIGLLLALLIAIGNGNYIWYFNQFQAAARLSNDGLLMATGNYLRTLPAGAYVYGVDGDLVNLAHPTLQFLAPSVHGCDAPLTAHAAHLDLSACPPAPRGAPLAFVIESSHGPLLRTIKRRFPGGSSVTFRSGDPSVTVVVYRTR